MMMVKFFGAIVIPGIVVYHNFASARNHANGRRRTPPGPEGSNGKRMTVAP